jgi:hypothetical protein
VSRHRGSDLREESWRISFEGKNLLVSAISTLVQQGGEVKDE